MLLAAIFIIIFLFFIIVITNSVTDHFARIREHSPTSLCVGHVSFESFPFELAISQYPGPYLWLVGLDSLAIGHESADEILRYKFQMEGRTAIICAFLLVVHFFFPVWLHSFFEITITLTCRCKYLCHIYYTKAMLSYILSFSHYPQPMSTTHTHQPLDQVEELPSWPQEKEASQAWKSGSTLEITLPGKTYCTSQSDYIYARWPQRAACLAKWRQSQFDPLLLLVKKLYSRLEQDC